MSLKWLESIMYKFLDVYHQHDCLWNHRSATYKNKEAREYAIDCIVKDMEIPGLTISDIKNKIKTVRIMYKKEHSLVQKSIKSGMGTGELYTPKLFWFKRADVFLNAVTHTRDTASNLILQNDEGDSETASASVITDVSYNTQEEEVLLDKTPKQSKPTHSRKRKLSSSDSISHIRAAIDKLDEVVQTNKTSNDDEFDTFAKYVAVQLRQMPLYDALVCQEDIQRVIMQRRLVLLLTRQSQDEGSTSSGLPPLELQTPPSHF